MEKKLMLKKADNSSFPDENYPAILTTFRYNAQRMGNAPTISGTLEYRSCLDDEWTDDVYIEFRGERFFLKQTPTSSYDNSKVTYSHSVELISERHVLENVYFYDSLTAYSSVFSFSGDIEHFCIRFNDSAKKSGIAYTVVVDEGVSSTDTYISFQDNSLYEALESAYKTYGVPFYFVGKEIHFGDAKCVIGHTLKYGQDNTLISISKNNTGNEIINRITGSGSDRNIPYYYPNPTPKGYLALSGASRDSYHITDSLKFSANIDIDRPFHYSIGQAEITGYNRMTTKNESFSNLSSIRIENIDTYAEYSFNISFNAYNAGTSLIKQVPLRMRCVVGGKLRDLTQYIFASKLADASGNEWSVTVDKNRSNNHFVTNSAISYFKRDFQLQVNIGLIASDLAKENEDIYIYIEPDSRAWVKSKDIFVKTDIAKTFSTEMQILVSRLGPGVILVDNTFESKVGGYVDMSSMFISGETVLEDEYISVVYRTDDGRLFCGDLDSGQYTVRCLYKLGQNTTPRALIFKPELSSIGVWKYDDDDSWVDFNNAGIAPKQGVVPGNYDRLKQISTKRVNTQNNLMPSLYRDTDGDERFYSAENGKYTDDNGEDVIFHNTYSPMRPREYIFRDEDIYPTIEGIKNSSGLRIDMFSEFAFDEDDNDEIYPVGHEKEGKYVHPYFFGKLRKTNGEHGFNLFDCAIEGQPMTISMKTGDCAACNFTVGVSDTDEPYNTVQVSLIDKTTVNGTIPAGTLLRDSDGNVLCGRWPQPKQPKQERQNDTRNNEVWIALKKDINTFNTIMPNASLRPANGDTFVILNINLPEQYITHAEKRLERAIIKHMAENNDYKFSFSVKMSSIFCEENKELMKTVDENCKAVVEYNGIENEYFVKSFSYNMHKSNPLPEITMELVPELSDKKGAIATIKDSIKSSVYEINSDISIVRDETITSIGKIERNNEINNSKIESEINKNRNNLDFLRLSITDSYNSFTSWRQGFMGGIPDDTPKGIISAFKINTSIEITRIKAEKSYIGNRSVTSIVEFTPLASDNQTILKDANGKVLYVRVEATYEILRDKDGKILKDANGRILKVRIDDEGYNDYKTYIDAADKYEEELMISLNSVGVPDNTPELETARVNYYKALDKVQNRININNDVKFLKKVFGEERVLDAYAATLSSLVAVMDEDKEVRAGLYGGGVEELDSIGLKSGEHGALMVFAGAQSLDDVGTSRFRVYEDGTVYQGVTRRAKTTITPSTLYKYISLDIGIDASISSTLNLLSVGSFIVLSGFNDGGLNVSGQTKIRLPYYNGEENYPNNYSIDDYLSLVGQTIVLRFTNEVNTTKYCFDVFLKNKGVGGFSSTCLAPSENEVILLTCEADMIEITNEDGTTESHTQVGWKMQKLN